MMFTLGMERHRRVHTTTDGVKIIKKKEKKQMIAYGVCVGMRIDHHRQIVHYFVETEKRRPRGEDALRN